MSVAINWPDPNLRHFDSANTLLFGFWLFSMNSMFLAVFVFPHLWLLKPVRLNTKLSIFIL